LKKRIRLTSLQILISCGLLLLVSLFVCCLAPKKGKEAPSFRQFCQELFIREMTANAIDLHYSLAHPERFGITEHAVTLPVYEPGSELGASEYPVRLLAALRAYKRESLSREDQYAYACLERILELSADLASHPYYADPLSPTQGMQCELPILLCEYSFRTRQDVEEYLQLLSQTGTYFSSLLTYEREKAAAGLSPSAVSLRKVAEQCDAIVTSEELARGEHFLQTSFSERLLELSASEALSGQELADLTARNDALLTSVLLPAFQDLRAGVLALAEDAPDGPTGLSAYPEGKAYYGTLLAYVTGSSKSPEEVKRLLEEVLDKETKNVRTLLTKYPELSSLPEDGMDDASAILSDLRQKMEGDFPDLPSECLVTVKTVSPSLSPYCAPAFYLTAPVDETDRNVIYVNPASNAHGLDLYVTLAHEGYPGHLYQNAYAGASLLLLENPFPRLLINCGGYVEGWALYVEQKAYDYVASSLSEQGNATAAARVILEKHYRSLQLCLYSLLDLMIHYENAGMEEILQVTSPYGIQDASALTAIYEYVCESPCNYPKYYLGYLEILELRKQAMTAWGADYSDLEFHRFLLDHGPADFQNLPLKFETRD